MPTANGIDISNQWTDINVATGFPIGSQLLVQNLGRAGDVIEVAISDTQPVDSFRGEAIVNLQKLYRVTPSSIVWMRYVRYDLTNTVTPSRVCRVSIQNTAEIEDATSIPYASITTNDRIKTAINPEVVGGNQAINVQSFVELNSKLGNQFEASFFTSQLAVDASADIIFQVGPSDDVLIKDIISLFNSNQIQTMVYREPTFTGGTPIPIYNLNDRDAKAEDVTILANATVTDEGAQVGPTITTIGSTQVGNRIVSTTGLTPGAERVFAKGVTYLYRITNTGTGASDISGVATWYQGPLSTQEPAPQ